MSCHAKRGAFGLGRSRDLTRATAAAACDFLSSIHPQRRQTAAGHCPARQVIKAPCRNEPLRFRSSFPCYDEEQTIPRLCAAARRRRREAGNGGRPDRGADHRRRLARRQLRAPEAGGRDAALDAAGEFPSQLRPDRGDGGRLRPRARRLHRPDGRRPAERSRRHPALLGAARRGLRRRLGLAQEPPGQGALAQAAVDDRQLADRPGDAACACTTTAARSRPTAARCSSRCSLYGEMHRFIPVYAKWSGARITEQVVRHHAAQGGEVEVRHGRTLKVLLDLTTVKFLRRLLDQAAVSVRALGLLLIAGRGLRASSRSIEKL